MINKASQSLGINCVNAGVNYKNEWDMDRSRDTCLHQPAAAQGLLLLSLRTPQLDRYLYEFKHIFHYFNSKRTYTTQ